MRIPSATNRAPRLTPGAPQFAIHDSRFAIGFTMIEMLTVIAIIAILAGFLMPALNAAKNKANIAKAQTAVAGLGTAFKAYYTEYGKWPIAYPATVTPPYPYEDFIVDHNVIALLSGQDPSSLTYLGGPNPVVSIDTTKNGLNFGLSIDNAFVQGNTRQILFLEFKQEDIKKDNSIDPLPNGAYFADPWGRPYHFRLDVRYANQVENPFIGAAAAAANPMTGMGFLIWSVGRDGKYDQGDTIVGTPPPLVVQSSALNKDNVRSW